MKKINWVAQKLVDHNKVVKLMEPCQETNQYANYGCNVKSLEKFIKKKFEINDDKAVVCCTNGSVALHCLASAIDLYNNQNDEIDEKIKWTTQSFTFPASVQGSLCDAQIVDIDRDGGLNLDLVSKDSGGIIVTNIFGNVVDIDKYVKWCSENNKYLIFDNAATAYTFYKGQNSCNYGVGSTISFHHTKPFGFGEGGAIIVDKCYEECVRRLINFGFWHDKNLGWNRMGSNYKMSEISAIYILQYLGKNFDKIVKHHDNLYKIVGENPKYKLYPNFADKKKPCVLSCFCFIDGKFTKEYVNELNKQGIMCRKYYVPLENTKIATEMYDNIMCFPCNLDLDSSSLKSYNKN